MSLEHEQMMDVMAYVDGELAGEDLARVEKLVASNADAKELHASLVALGDGVRTAHIAPDVDIRDVVMQKIAPNDLDKARIRRTARTRMVVVAAAFVAIAAGVLFYMRDQNNVSHTTKTAASVADSASAESALASAAATGVQVDFVDTPTAVSVFYLPAEPAGAEVTDTPPPSVVVWVDDSMVGMP